MIELNVTDFKLSVRIHPCPVWRPGTLILEMSRTLSGMCVLIVLVSGQEGQVGIISSEITLDLEIQIEVKEPDVAGANKTADKLGPTIEAVEATLYEYDYDEGNVITESDNTLSMLDSNRTTEGDLNSNISVTFRPTKTDNTNVSQDASVTFGKKKHRVVKSNCSA